VDREAMRSVTGGARTGVRPVHIDQAMAGSGRIVDYPPGFGCPPAQAGPAWMRFNAF
jgi:hypothetical protein